jgi:hypothetical protein
MNITINDILKMKPCAEGIEELYTLIGASYDKDKYLDIDLLASKLSLSNICWVLGALHKKEILVKLAIFSAEQVIHIYEESNNSKAPRLAIEAAKAYINEPIEADRLACKKTAAYASYAAHAASAASESTTFAASAAHAARAAARAADSATYDAYAAYAAYAADAIHASSSSSSSKDVESKIREYLIQLLKEASL